MVRKLFPALFLLAALLVPGAGHATANCSDGSLPTYARFVQPEDGMIQAQTGPTGVLTLQTGGVTPSVFLSTTGQITVEIEQSCLLTLVLTVFKDGQTSPVYTNSWQPECTQSNILDEVNIGLDGGSYNFQLSGTACNGKPLRTNGKGGVVGDPPIL